MVYSKRVSNMSMKFFSRIFTLTIVMFFGAQNVFAAPGYTVSPLVINTDAEARDILTYDITLKNTGTQQMTIYPTVNNISLDEGGTIESFLSPAMSDRTASLAAWIEISRRGVSLQVGESKTVTMTLRINPNPVPGTYNALIGFGYGNNQYEATELVKSGRAQGTVVTVTIVEKKNEFLRLSKFIIDRFVTSNSNQSAVYNINNPGDTTLVPGGDIIFYNNRGVEVGAIPVNPERESILAGETKEFNVNVPMEGLFGKYKARLSVEYGSSQLASVQDTTFFYVFPFKMMLMFLGVLSVLIILAAYLFHRRYFDEEIADEEADLLHVHVRDSVSEAKEHDIDLKKQ